MNIAVVGSNRGIGLEFCRQLILLDHSVTAFCRHSSSQLNELNIDVVENFDVRENKTSKKSVASLPESSFDWYIHVSGILRSDDLGSLTSTSIEEQFLTNALSPLLCTRSFLPKLKSGAKIAWLTSRMGSIQDNTSGGQYGYRMSKAALNAAGKSLSLDIKTKNIALLLLHPGWVKTDMTNFNGQIEVDESVKGMIKIISEKTIEHTGTFGILMDSN